MIDPVAQAAFVQDLEESNRLISSILDRVTIALEVERRARASDQRLLARAIEDRQRAERELRALRDAMRRSGEDEPI